LYAEAITLATHAAYAPEDDRMQMVATGWADSIAARHPKFTTIARLDSVHTLIASARYDEFRDAIRALAAANDGVRITEIAGNRQILLTGVAPSSWRFTGVTAAVDYALPLPTDPSRQRVVMRVPVGDLLALLRQLDAEGRFVVDHIYDY
jgi:hypothetical protein